MKTEERRLIGLKALSFFSFTRKVSNQPPVAKDFYTQSLRVIGLNTISTHLHWWVEPWPCDLSVINSLDPSEDQQNHSYTQKKIKENHTKSLFRGSERLTLKS